MKQSQHVICIGNVHEAFIRYNEMDRYEREFVAALERQHPGVPFALVMKPHPNMLLRSAGDFQMVAYSI